MQSIIVSSYAFHSVYCTPNTVTHSIINDFEKRYDKVHSQEIAKPRVVKPLGELIKFSEGDRDKSTWGIVSQNE